MKFTAATLALFTLMLTASPAWSGGARFAAPHVSTSHTTFHSHSFHSMRAGRYRNYGGGGGGGDEQVARYVPTQPNYVQSDGAGYWAQDKYTGTNPVNQVYH